MNKTTIETKPTIETKSIVKKDFNNLPVECRVDENGTLWLTAEVLGQALGYTEPRKCIVNLINRYKRSLTNFTAVIKIMTPGHGHQNVTVINEKGCHLIAMKANTARADDFCNWLADLAIEYHHGRLQAMQPRQSQTLPKTYPSAALLREMRKQLDSNDMEMWLKKELDIPIPPAKIIKKYLDLMTVYKLKNEMNKHLDVNFYAAINAGDCDKERVAGLCGLKAEDIWR